MSDKNKVAKTADKKAVAKKSDKKRKFNIVKTFKDMWAELKKVGIVALVLLGIVVALLALLAGQRNLDALIRCQLRHLPYIIRLPRTSAAAGLRTNSCHQNNSPHPGQTIVL